jgi:hypothetical protein
MEAAAEPESLRPSLDEIPVGAGIIRDFLQDFQQFLPFRGVAQSGPMITPT